MAILGRLPLLPPQRPPPKLPPRLRLPLSPKQPHLLRPQLLPHPSHRQLPLCQQHLLLPALPQLRPRLLFRPRLQPLRCRAPPAHLQRQPLHPCLLRPPLPQHRLPLRPLLRHPHLRLTRHLEFPQHQLLRTFRRLRLHPLPLQRAPLRHLQPPLRQPRLAYLLLPQLWQLEFLLHQAHRPRRLHLQCPQHLVHLRHLLLMFRPRPPLRWHQLRLERRLRPPHLRLQSLRLHLLHRQQPPLVWASLRRQPQPRSRARRRRRRRPRLLPRRRRNRRGMVRSAWANGSAPS